MSAPDDDVLLLEALAKHYEAKHPDIAAHMIRIAGRLGALPAVQSKGKPNIGIKRWLEECAAAGEKPIPPDDAVFVYVEKVGIPREFLELQWREFKQRATDSSKLYKDWRKAFRNSVTANWYGLWYIGRDGGYVLSTTGTQAKKFHEERKAA